MRAMRLFRRMAITMVLLMVFSAAGADIARADCPRYCYTARDRCYDACNIVCMPLVLYPAYWFNCMLGCRTGCYLGWLQCCTDALSGGGDGDPGDIQPE